MHVNPTQFSQARAVEKCLFKREKERRIDDNEHRAHPAHRIGLKNKRYDSSFPAGHRDGGFVAI